MRPGLILEEEEKKKKKKKKSPHPFRTPMINLGLAVFWREFFMCAFCFRKEDCASLAKSYGVDRSDQKWKNEILKRILLLKSPFKIWLASIGIGLFQLGWAIMGLGPNVVTLLLIVRPMDCPLLS